MDGELNRLQLSKSRKGRFLPTNRRTSPARGVHYMDPGRAFSTSAKIRSVFLDTPGPSQKADPASSLLQGRMALATLDEQLFGPRQPSKAGCSSLKSPACSCVSITLP